MMSAYQVGDLVHIPQSVDLIDCDVEADPQLTIPLRVQSTKCPKIGVVTYISSAGYVRVFCDGLHWSVNDKNLYKLG
jgi:hypothetical protein